MKRFKNILMASALLCGAFFTACDDNDDKPVFPENQDQAYDMSGFAKGADVSWLTEMERKVTNSMMLKETDMNVCHYFGIWA